MWMICEKAIGILSPPFYDVYADDKWVLFYSDSSLFSFNFSRDKSIALMFKKICLKK